MCGCGKYSGTAGDQFGIVKGVLEMHSTTTCITKKVSRWRRRVFGPVAAFFQRLAGEDHRELFAWLDQRERDRRAALAAENRENRRARLRAAMFGNDS